MARRNTAVRADAARFFKCLHREHSPTCFRSTSTAPTVPAPMRNWFKARMAISTARHRVAEAVAAETFSKSSSSGRRRCSDLNGTNGSSPDAELVQGADGNFYGTASSGGSGGGGNIFQIIIVRTAPVFLFASQTAGALTLTWSAVVGQTYQMQYCANLIQGGWSNFGGTIVATNATILTIDPAPSDPQRFYRIVLQ